AETGQLQWAVSFNKGCYLGQEVVERMRSRGVVARKLCGLFVEGGVLPPKETALIGPDGKTAVGKITSVCRSIALDRVIALGYVKSSHAIEGTTLQLNWNEGTAAGTVTPLPFVSDAASLH
ncbi:MAG: glycine cleavage T C-terminal barrel domain-containing protein, partial [Planctomycetota bacterium]